MLLLVLGASIPAFADGGLSIEREMEKGPLFIPHRGDALRAPEHTAVAYASSTARGFPWVEMDYSELVDGHLVAFHDWTVDRITTSSGRIERFNSAGYSRLVIDSDIWHGGGYGDLNPQFLRDVLEEYKGRAIFVVDEKKGGNGRVSDELTSAGIPAWQAMVAGQTYKDLAAAVAAGYSTLVIGSPSTNFDPDEAIRNGVGFVAIDHLRGADFIRPWVAAGVNVLCFTVQRRYDRDLMLGLGVKGFFSDDTQYLSSNSPFSSVDSFSAQTWLPGMIAQNYKNSIKSTDDGLDEVMRGRFVAPDKWGFTRDSGTNLAHSVLQGWASPINSKPDADSYSVELSITFGAVGNDDQTRWAGAFLASDDRAYESTPDGVGGPVGYLFFMRKNGEIAIAAASNNQSSDVILARSTADYPIADNEEVMFRLSVTPSQLKIERLDDSGAVVQSVVSSDATPGRRGGYLHLVHSRMPALFRRISIH